MMYALRVLGRHKLFAVLQVISLGVAIGLCSVVYGLFDAMMNPILTIRAPETLLWVSYNNDWRYHVAAETHNEYISRMTSISSAASATVEYHQFVSRGSQTRSPRVLTVSPNYFQLLGVSAKYGRLLGPVDHADGSRPVVLSERLWRQLFRDSREVGLSTILLNQEPRQVIGVVRLEADFPGAYTDVWQLESPAATVRKSLVRIRPGLTESAVRAEFRTVAAGLATLTSEPPGTTWFRIRRAVGEPFRLLRFHVALIVAVIAVYLTACLNLTNLQLTRGMQRARELATLSALGLSRAGLVRLMVLETAIVAAAGLALAVWLTFLGVGVVRSSVPPSIGDYLIQPQVSWRVFMLSAAAAAGASLLVGLLPAIRLSRVDINSAMKSGAELFRSNRSWTRALLIAQVSLALVVIIGAGLLLRTVGRLQSFEVGADSERLISANVLVSPHGAGDLRDVGNVSTELLGVGGSLAGVQSASTARIARPDRGVISVAVEGKAPREVAAGSWTYSVVSPNYFRTLGVPAVSGRFFTREETETAVVVDKATASHLWPNENPVGRMIKFGPAHSRAPWLMVTGVVSKSRPLRPADSDELPVSDLKDVFVMSGHDSTRLTSHSFFQLLVRAGSSEAMTRVPNLLDRRLRDLGVGIEVLGVMPVLRMQGIQTLRERQTFVAGVFAAFALVALASVILGVYATFSQSVALRQREYAVRIALGATSSQVRQSVTSEAKIIILLGIALGLAGAALTVDGLAAFVRSARDRHDSVAFGIVAIVAFATMWLASYLPARRASRVDVSRALTVE